MTPLLRSERYLISRTELAKLAAEEYIRKYWFIIIPIPLTGLLLLVTSTGLTQAFGLMALMWPITIPARSVLGSSKPAKLFTQGVVLSADEDALYFAGDNGKGFKLDLGSVGDLEVRGAYLLIRMRRLAFVPVPISALPDERMRQKLVDIVRQAIERRLNR